MTFTFIPWLLDSLDLPRYISEWPHPGYCLWLTMAWPLFNCKFCYQETGLLIFGETIYLFIQMYFIEVYFHFLWSGKKLTNSFGFLNFLFNLHATWTIKESKILRRFRVKVTLALGSYVIKPWKWDQKIPNYIRLEVTLGLHLKNHVRTASESCVRLTLDSSVIKLCRWDEKAT